MAANAGHALPSIGTVLRLFYGLVIILGTCTYAGGEEAPRFILHPQSTVANLNTRVILTCEARPRTAEITWTHNGEDIQSSEERGVRIEAGRLEILSFKHEKKQKSHKGHYQCVANNSVGAVVSQVAILSRAVLGEFGAAKDMNITATVGNVALIPCDPPKGMPPPTIMYEVNGTTIDKESGRHHFMPSGSLQISNVKVSDEGLYRCISINPSNGQKQIAPNRVNLKVYAPTTNSPSHIVKGPVQKVQAIKGQNLTLECVVEGSPVPVVTWDKYGGQLPESERCHKNLGNLVITNIELLDQGTYICRAENGVGTPHAAVSMVEVLQPPTITLPPTDRVAALGSAVTFTCHVQGRPKFRVMWLHNGVKVKKSNLISISNTELTINSFQEEHAGMYQCLAKNRLGMDVATARLKVQSDRDSQSGESRTQNVNNIQDIAPDTLATEDHRRRLEAELEEEKKKAMTTENPTNQKVTTFDIFMSNSSGSGVKPNRNRGSSGSRKNKKNKNRKRNRDRSRNRDRENARKRVLEPEEEEIIDEEMVEEGMGGNREQENIEAPSAGTEGENGGKKGKLVPPSRPRVEKLSDTSVMLAWTVGQNNGLAITFFKVQYKEMTRKRSRWRTIDEDIPSNMRRFEVSGLRPGSVYRFRVLAVYSNNDNKQGPTSAKFALEVEPSRRLRAPSIPPAIVAARSISQSEMYIRWQQLREDNAHIEGYIIFYKPFHSSGDYKQVRLLGGLMDQNTVGKLKPETDYEFKMRSFNSAGHSEFSNQVVKRTLSGDGNYPPLQENPFEMEFPPDYTTVKSSVYTYPTHVHNTKNSSELLYTVLGIVLGIMMLALIIFMALCGWKQRQQRALLASTLNDGRKFDDPARSIYNNTMGKKTMSNGHTMNGTPQFALNSLPRVSNGHVQNGTIPNYTASNRSSRISLRDGSMRHNGKGSRPNITLNPMTGEIEGLGSDTESRFSNQVSLQDLRNSLQEVLPPPPYPPPQLSTTGDHYSRNSPAYFDRGSEQNSIPDHTYNSLSSFQRHRAPPRGDTSDYGNSSHYEPSPRHYALENNKPLYTSSEDYIHGRHNDRSHNQSHDRLSSISSGSHNNRLPKDYSWSPDGVSHDQYSSHSLSNKKRRKRRHHHHNHHHHHPHRNYADSDGVTRDMATNTDLSSNEDTLDSHKNTSSSKDHLNNHLPVLDNAQHSSYSRTPTLNLPRVTDYPVEEIET